eukprot:1803330-Prymnesium_polylepis.1
MVDEEASAPTEEAFSDVAAMPVPPSGGRGDGSARTLGRPSGCTDGDNARARSDGRTDCDDFPTNRGPGARTLPVWSWAAD